MNKSGIPVIINKYNFRDDNLNIVTYKLLYSLTNSISY